jgi:hypothetical protein
MISEIKALVIAVTTVEDLPIKSKKQTCRDDYSMSRAAAESRQC